MKRLAPLFLVALLLVSLSACIYESRCHRGECFPDDNVRLGHDALDRNPVLGSNQLGPRDMIRQQGGPDPEALEWTRKSAKSLKAGNWAETIRTASIAIRLNPLAEDAYINRSWAYFKKGLFDETISDCRTAIDINRRNPVCYNHMGLASLHQNKPDDALQYLTSALFIDGRNPLTFNSLGLVYENMGDREKALNNYRASCDLQFPTACDNYAKLTGFRPADIPRVVTGLVEASGRDFQKGDWDAVITKCSQALKLDASSAAAYASRGAAYANKKMTREALSDCNEAIRINPDSALGYNNRAYAKELDGHIQAAVLDYEIACNLKLDPACTNVKRLAKGETLKPGPGARTATEPAPSSLDYRPIRSLKRPFGEKGTGEEGR